MAYPVTLSGLSTAVAIVGPYKSSGGNYYLFGRDGNTANFIDSFKATDPTSSWSATGDYTSGGAGTSIGSIGGSQVGDAIILIHSDVIGSTTTVRRSYFGMDDETFADGGAIASGNTAGQTGSQQTGCSIVHRSNGNGVAFFNGAQTKKSGTYYARVYWSELTSSWSAAVEVDAGGAFDATSPRNVLGTGDAVHNLWLENNNCQQRTLNSSNALQTASTAIAASVLSPAASFNSSGTQKIIFHLSGTNANYFDSANTPTLSNTAALSPAVSVPCRFFLDGTDVWCIGRYSTDSDLYAFKSTDAGHTYGSGTNIFAATVASGELNLSVDARTIWQRGSVIEIPYVCNDGGTLKVNGYTVRTLAIELSATSLTVGSPVLGTPTLETAKSLLATSLTVGSPNVASEYQYVPAQITDSAWVPWATAVVPNATIAPDGTTTAEAFYETAVNTQHYIRRDMVSPNPPAGHLTAFAEVKANGRSWIQINNWEQNGGNHYSLFDVTNGQLGTTQTGLLSRSITDLGNGWYLCSITMDVSGAEVNGYIYLAISTQDSTMPAYAGDVTKGFYIGRVGFVVGDVATYGPPIFDSPNKTVSATSLTVGAPELGVSTNLIASDQITSAENYAHVSFSANSAIDPYGAMAADKVIEDTATNVEHYAIFNVNLTIGSQTSFWYDIQAAGRTWVQLLCDGGYGQAFFNTADGSWFGETGLTSKDAINLGAGWWRLRLTRNANYASSTFGFRLATDNHTSSYTGDGTSGIYIGKCGVTYGTNHFLAPKLGQKHALTATSSWVASPVIGPIYSILTASAASVGQYFGLPGTRERCGQTFTATADVAVGSVVFCLSRSNNPTDQLYADIYATDANKLPTGSSLGTSDSIDGASLSTTATSIEFKFQSPINLQNGSRYTAIISRSGELDETNRYVMYGQNTDSYAVNGQDYYQSGAWYYSDADWLLRVYGTQPSLSLIATLSATSLAVQAPTFGTPALAITVPLSATSFAVSSALTFGTPTLTQKHVLSATNYADSALTFGTPTISQKHVLSAESYVDSPPTFGTPVAAITVPLSATSLIVNAPTFGTPSIGQKHVLAATSYEDTVPSLGSPSIGQKHTLTATSYADGALTIGTPPLGIVVPLSATSLAVNVPTFGTPSIGQKHALSASEFTDAVPSFGTPSIGQKHVLAATSFDDSPPVLPTPQLSVSSVAFIAVSLTVGAPTIGAPAEGIVHNLLATSYDGSAPVIGTPTITQKHVLSATSFDDSQPTFDTPSMVVGRVLSATSLSVGVPVFSAPTIAQKQALSATGVTAGVPVLGSPPIAVAVNLTAQSYADSAPTFGTPTIGQKHALAATSFVDAVPVVSAATLAQKHVLSATSLAVQAPVIGTATASIIRNLAATDLSAGVPVIGAPTFTQTYGQILATSLEVGPPVLDAPAIHQKQVLAAASLIGGAPSLGQATIAQKQVLTATGLAVSPPTLQAPALHQSHSLAAVGLAVTGLVIGEPGATAILNGLVSATEQPDSVQGSGTVDWQLQMAASEAPDQSVITGAVTGIVAHLDAVESADQAAMAAVFSTTGVFHASERPDTLAFRAPIPKVEIVELFGRRGGPAKISGREDLETIEGHA